MVDDLSSLGLRTRRAAPARGATPYGTCALAVLLTLQSTGCFTASTSEVHVRDPRDVALSGPSGAAILRAAPTPTERQVVLERGRYWDWFSRKPYEVHAVREPTGAIALRCDTCSHGFLTGLTGVSGTSYVRLLDASGRTMPTASALVDQDGGPAIHVGYDVCMRETSSADFTSCDVPARLSLDVPVRDVVEVRRRVEPVRVWGYLLLAMGAATLAAGTVAIASPAFGPSFVDRAPKSAILLVPGAILAAFGVWESFSPARVQVWKPE